MLALATTYALLWNKGAGVLLGGLRVGPGRRYRQTMSRGPMVRKKASRLQVEAIWRPCWQQLPAVRVAGGPARGVTGASSGEV